jgi:F-type H+-transporting ATPase subunit epsilon
MEEPAGKQEGLMQLTVRIVNPDKIVYDGTAEYLIAPGVHGGLGIMPGHTPLFAELVSGDILIQNEKEELVAVESGIVRVKNDTVTILIGPA